MFVKQSSICQKWEVGSENESCDLVAISVNDVVPSGSFVVDEELDGGHRLDFAQLREQFLAFWTGNCGHQGGGGWLLQ